MLQKEGLILKKFSPSACFSEMHLKLRMASFLNVLLVFNLKESNCNIFIVHPSPNITDSTELEPST
jgi:hypothetical protein